MMGFNDHIDFDLHEKIQDLLDENELEENSVAHGVAKQTIHSGYESLSAKQKYVYDNEIGPALQKRAEQMRAEEAASSC